MPMTQAQVPDAQKRLWAMLQETLDTLREINRNADVLFGNSAPLVRAAIEEFLRDFIDSPSGAGQIHPERLIYATSLTELQGAGLYGHQLDLKERQVMNANQAAKQSLGQKLLAPFRRPFRKWVDVVNNLLSSLPIGNVGEALKELKDCLRDELPDE